MNNQLTVSVIIPVFNGAQYIRGAVESVLNQTFKDLEIIVIDDGSTDNTKKLLEDWISKGRIRYIFQENRGLAAARNAGVKAAQSKYIKFLDHDDFLYPEQIEKQFAQIKDSENLISISDSCFLRPNGEIITRKYYPADEERHAHDKQPVNDSHVKSIIGLRAQKTVVALRKRVSPCVDRSPNAAVPRW